MELDNSSGSSTPEATEYPPVPTNTLSTREQIEKRQAEEKEFIRIHDSAEAGAWYLIDVNWLQAWKLFVTRGGQLPGPIDNHRLVDRQTGLPKIGLRAVDDYRGVNGEIWTFWSRRYGGGPTIRRRQLDLYARDEDPDTHGKEVQLPGTATPSPSSVSSSMHKPSPPQGQSAQQQSPSRGRNFFSIGSRGSSSTARSQPQSPQSPQSAQQQSPAQASTPVAQEKLCCDKCDGPHETDKCPHFKKARDKHADAWSGKGKAQKLEDADGEGAPIIRSSEARVYPQPGDGSCLFHSLSYGLGGSSSANSLRSDICGYIAKNPGMTIADTAIEDWIRYDSDSNETVAQYARRMAGDTWGGGIEMAALTKMKNVNVHVYEKCHQGYRRISAFDNPNARKTICVLYQGRNHYDAMVV